MIPTTSRGGQTRRALKTNADPNGANAPTKEGEKETSKAHSMAEKGTA